jgi:hypothetical protein
MHSGSGLSYKIEVFQKGMKTFQYERSYSTNTSNNYEKFEMTKALPTIYDKYDQILTFHILPKSALASQSEIILNPDFKKGEIVEWEITANLGNPFFDVRSSPNNFQMNILLSRPYYPELDGEFSITFKVKSMELQPSKDFDLAYAQYYPTNNVSETGLVVLDTNRKVDMVKSGMEMDLVVNFGKRCCYNQDITGPARFIIDFGINYVTGQPIEIQYRYLLKYASYKSRFVQMKCTFGWKFDDLYIDSKCQITNSSIIFYVPKGITLTPGNRIPVTLQYLGERIGVVGRRGFPVDRPTVVYPRQYNAYAGTFTAIIQ